MQAASSTPCVWLNVVDPSGADASKAIEAWEHHRSAHWAVPASAGPGDLVIAWLAGGAGFRYILQIESTRAASEEEAGPRQASLRLRVPIDHPVSMSQLKSDPVLKDWWAVRASMQGLITKQRHSVTLEPEWSALLALLSKGNPAVGMLLGEVTPAQEAGGMPPRPAADVRLAGEHGASSSISATPRLRDAFARSAALTEGRDAFNLTFSSLWLAIAYGGDEVARWLSDYSADHGLSFTPLLANLKHDEASARQACILGMQRREDYLQRPLTMTSSSRAALDAAKSFAGSQGAPEIDSQHVLYGLASLDTHRPDFEKMGLDRAAFAHALAVFAAGSKDRAERYRPEYHADAYSSRDLLAINEEVEALAYVIASKHTQPPLAIGLFGEWGSGKTFFMKHLRSRIQQVSSLARDTQAPAERECLGHIAQIEFNAWHYQEGDLWASLVDHILRNLRFGEDEEETKLAERRDAMVLQLAQTERRRDQASEDATAAQARHDQAERDIDTLKKEEEQRRQELAVEMSPDRIMVAARVGLDSSGELRTEAQSLARELGLPEVRRDASELRQTLLDARRELSGAWAFLLPLWRARDSQRRRRMLAIALLVSAGFAAAVWAGLYLLAYHEHAISKVASWSAGLAALMVKGRSWLQSQMQWIADIRGRVEPMVNRIDAEVDRQIETALAERKKAIADKLAEIERLRADQLRIERERDAAAAEVAQLQSGLNALGTDAVMRGFLDERIGGGIYQQKLGTAALVRRDFDRLSRSIEGVTRREAAGKVKADELIINRIVLYIDDLDRCDMDKVVPVLRAVHLLLAFPAFVVVVGVDSRWVARCLGRHHKDFFGGEQEAGTTVTPLDYLEKIFQIPIWLKPVSEAQRVSMVQDLMRSQIAEPATREAPPGYTEAGAGQTPAESGAAPAPAPSGAPPPSGEERRRPGPPGSAGDVDLNPEGLSISDDEHQFLAELGGLLSSSPRTIKRFVNTYRLLNVTLARNSVHDPGLTPPDFQIRMFLLAVFVEMPEFSRWMQRVVRESPATPWTPFVELLMLAAQRDSILSGEPSMAEQWRRVQAWLHLRGDAWTQLEAARVAQWLEPVGRYTFNLNRVRAAMGA